MPAKITESRPTQQGQTGRPREFDKDKALDAALAVFQSHGFEGASIARLSEAMGLTTGSIYKAFGDKTGLFLAAYAHYRAKRGQILAARLEKQQTGYEKTMEILRYYADLAHGESGNAGCLVITSAHDLANLNETAGDAVRVAFRENEARLLANITLGQKDGSIKTACDPHALAKMLLCLTSGMRVVGRIGASHDDMQQVTATAAKLLK